MLDTGQGCTVTIYKSDLSLDTVRAVDDYDAYDDDYGQSLSDD
jgi:hypothetical protein